MSKTVIAARRYDLDGYACTDTLIREDGQFRLVLESEHPQEPRRVEAMDERAALNWCVECPEQIGRAEDRADADCAGATTGQSPHLQPRFKSAMCHFHDRSAHHFP